MSKTFNKSINDVRTQIGLIADIQFSTFQTDLLHAISNDISPMIGKEFVIHLLNRHHATSPDPVLSDKEKELITLLQKAEAHIGIAYWTFKSNIQVQNFLKESKDQSSEAAKQWRVDDLRDFLFERGFSAIDDILNFLEENESDEKFSLWKNSDQNSQRKKLLVSNVKTFQTWHNISNSYRTYMALMPNLKFIQDFNVKAKFSPIWDKINENEYAEIKTVLQAALIKLAIAKACDQNIIDFSSGRLIIKSRRGNNNQHSKPEQSDLKQLQDHSNEEGAFLINTALKELNAKASSSKFKEWFESPLYSNPNRELYQDPNDKIYMG